ncbi:MAG TPA: LysM peptidoglycan-binding domain-containing protein, partial [Bacteroidetes bacterium]|nr:LysM peptidoglycan-binding domain-containing protein [Bacteroidota bacterium]
MKQLIVLICAGLFLIPMMGKASIPGDSIGVKTVDGKTYVLYRITQGDNLSQIAREYGASVAQLQEANGMEGVGLSIDQVILVPFQSMDNTAMATKTNTQPQKPGPVKKHVISRGESLWAISQTYKVSVQQIQEWNGLVGTSVSAGQQLIVSDPGRASVNGGAKSQGNLVATSQKTKTK